MANTFWQGCRLNMIGSLMTSLWNSPQQLSVALRWLTYGFIFLPAALGIAIYFVNDRIDSMKTEQGEIQQKLILEQQQEMDKQKVNIVNLIQDLSQYKAKAEQLQIQVIDSQRGVSETYDFNGAYRKQTGSGRTELSAGAEIETYKKIREFEKSHNWISLKSACEQQIELTPKWLTPYLFLGIALANLGDIAQAKLQLEFVVSRAGNDPNYSDASRLLLQLQSAPAR